MLRSSSAQAFKVVTIWTDGVAVPDHEKHELVRCLPISRHHIIDKPALEGLRLQPKREYSWRTYAEFVALHEQLRRALGPSAVNVELPTSSW